MEPPGLFQVLLRYFTVGPHPHLEEPHFRAFSDLFYLKNTARGQVQPEPQVTVNMSLDKVPELILLSSFSTEAFVL